MRQFVTGLVYNLFTPFERLLKAFRRTLKLCMGIKKPDHAAASLESRLISAENDDETLTRIQERTAGAGTRARASDHGLHRVAKSQARRDLAGVLV